MKIELGMVWYKDGHREEVTKMFKNGKCQVTETWISEDTWKNCKHVSHQIIVEDADGEQYIYDPKYEEYANPGKEEYSWWARTYACGATNVDEFKKEEKMNGRCAEDFLTEKGKRDLEFVTEIGARAWYDMHSGYVLLPLEDNETEKAVFDEIVHKFIDNYWIVELIHDTDEYGDPTEGFVWWIRSDRDAY